MFSYENNLFIACNYSIIFLFISDVPYFVRDVPTIHRNKTDYHAINLFWQILNSRCYINIKLRNKLNDNRIKLELKRIIPCTSTSK
jgi:hypothetical protein